VWTALQLIHEVALTPYQAKLPMQTAESSRGLVIYLPKLDDAVLAAVQESIHAAGQVVVYSRHFESSPSPRLTSFPN